MFYGIVKTVNFDRGFGFIAQEDRPDVYFHASAMDEGAFDRIGPDQPVMFDLAKRDPSETPGEKKGPRAARVKLLDRMPGGILPPPPQALAPRHHPKAKRRRATWKRRIEVSQTDAGTQKPESGAP